MPLGINDKDRIEKDRKGSDWIGSQILFQDGKRIGSDCRSIFDKRIGIGSQIQKKRIVQFSGVKSHRFEVTESEFDVNLTYHRLKH